MSYDEDRQELKKILKESVTTSEASNNGELNKKTKSINKFNKKVELKVRLRRLRAIAAVAASALNTNAQVNFSEGVQNDGNKNSIIANNNDKMLSFNYYQELKKGVCSYEQAKVAAEFVRNHPEGVYSIEMSNSSARRDYALEFAMKKSKEEFEKNIGIGDIGTNSAIYPKTQEAEQAMSKAERDALISKLATLDIDVTYYTIKSILNDNNIPEAQKDNMIVEESNEFFRRIEDGRYDRGNNNDRYLVKKNYLRLLETSTPQLASKLAAEQNIDMRKLQLKEYQR